MEKKFAIKIIVNATGHTDYVKVLKNTTRGTVVVEKRFTERAAKSWITRRMKELAGTRNENTWTYEIVER